MARSFHRRPSLPPIADLNVIPLIDLAFSLLIIFMIATPLIQSEKTLPVNLPVADSGDTRPPDQRTVRITIVPGGYDVDGVSMDGRALDSLLRTYTASRNQPTFSIRGDRDKPYQEVVSLLDLLKKNKLTKVDFESQSRR
jgi:biopolymer transport protein TolR